MHNEMDVGNFWHDTGHKGLKFCTVPCRTSLKLLFFKFFCILHRSNNMKVAPPRLTTTRKRRGRTLTIPWSDLCHRHKERISGIAVFFSMCICTWSNRNPSQVKPSAMASWQATEHISIELQEKSWCLFAMCPFYKEFFFPTSQRYFCVAAGLGLESNWRNQVFLFKFVKKCFFAFPTYSSSDM